MQDSRSSQRLVAGRYRLAEVLGRGGMGVVWRATDELIGRAVAVKEIRADPALPAEERALFGQRALREARTAGRISHPAVAAVHDVVPANADDEAVYIVSELVEAPSLADVLEHAGALPPARVTTMAVRILDALAAAHSSGVVHRDIKPGNIMVLDGDDVKLVDFGIAQADEDSRLTRNGVMGSTGYLAPELFHGAEPTPATDLWSVGVTLVQAVNGEAPFDRASTAATIRAVLHDDLPAVRCDPPLATVIAGLLARDPDRRMTLEQARTLLAGADAGADAAPGRAAGSGTGGPMAGAADWEQQPTTLHGRTAPGAEPRGPVRLAPPDPDAAFQVSPPQSIRRANLLALVVLLALSGWAGWILLHETLSMPLITVIVAVAAVWAVGASSVHFPWQGRLKITEEALVLQGTTAPTAQGRSDVVLRWGDVSELIVAPATAGSVDRTRITVGFATKAAAAPLSVPPFKGYLRQRVNDGPIWVVGDVVADPEEMAEVVEAAVPDHVTVADETGSAAGRLPAANRHVNPRRGGLVLWILLVLGLIGGTYYYRDQARDLVTLTEDATSVVAYGPDGTLLGSAAEDTVTVWNVATGHAVAILSGHGDEVTSLTFSPDGKLLLSGDDGGAVKLWDVSTQRNTATLAVDDSGFRIVSARFSPDGTAFAVADYAGNVALWRLANLGRPVPVDAEGIDVGVIRFSADSRILLGVDEEKGVRRFWQTTSGASVRPAGTFGPMATVRPDNSVLIRDAGSDRILTTLRGNTNSVTATAFGPGDLFATRTWDDIRVWRTTTGRTVRVLGTNLFRLSGPDCDSLALSPDGQTLACGGDDGLRLWAFGAER